MSMPSLRAEGARKLADHLEWPGGPVRILVAVEDA